ncbi:MAG: bifunctional phosphoribosyl-AMP cyclohydrolase/phosphoribosyl-ATP diphosphatase HisIE [Rhodothermia bacterium]
MNWSELKTEDGLVPAIVQDARTGQVLMLAYMNREAFAKTLETGLVTFFSRSRGKLWTKGETSGNFLRYVSHRNDCDGDAILVKARPDGPTCHTGARTCFVDSPDGSFGFLGELEAVIVSRENTDPKKSYTSELLSGGPAATARKVGEEAVEVTIAAITESDERLAEESADLVYHLLVLLRSRGLSLNDVAGILEERHTRKK